MDAPDQELYLDEDLLEEDGFAVSDGDSVAAGLYALHGHKTSAESQQARPLRSRLACAARWRRVFRSSPHARRGGCSPLSFSQVCAVLSAVLAVIEEQQLQPSPVAVFAASLASLQHADVRGSAEARTHSALTRPLATEAPRCRDSRQMTAAVCTVLGAAALRAEPGSLRSAAPPAAPLLAAALSASLAAGAGGAARASASALGAVLGACGDRATWPPLARPFSALMASTTDANPKHRRAGVAGAAAALRGLGGGSAGAGAHAAIARWAAAALRPPLTLTPATPAEEAEAVVSAALHVLGALASLGTSLRPAFPAAAHAAADVAALLTLSASPSSPSPHLAAKCCDALSALASCCAVDASHAPRLPGSPAPHQPPPPDAAAVAVQALCDVGIAKLSVPARIALASALGAAASAFASADPRAAAELLPPALGQLSRLVRSAPTSGGDTGGGAAAASADAMRALVACMDSPAVNAAVRFALRTSTAAPGSGAQPHDLPPSAQPPPLIPLCAGFEALLGFRYRASWPVVLPVVSTLIERLGPSCGALLPGAFAAIAQMGSATSSHAAPAPLRPLVAQLAGAAVRAAGAERVLALLPLRMGDAAEAAEAAAEAAARAAAAAAAAAGGGDAMDDDGGEAAAAAAAAAAGGRMKRPPLRRDDGDAAGAAAAAAAATAAAAAAVAERDAAAAGNAWLLPLLSRHAVCSRLAVFASSLLPASRAAAARAAWAKSASKPLAAARAEALEAAVWGVLPAMATYPEDTPSAFPPIARELGDVIASRPELRPPVCAALCRLLTLFSALVSAPSQQNADESSPEARDAAADAAAAMEDVVSLSPVPPPPPPPGFEAASATAAVAVVASFARNFMPLLFNAFVATKPGSAQRHPLGAAISAFARAAEPPSVSSFFRMGLKKLLSSASPDAAAADGGGASSAGEEGGATRGERRATFFDLLLCLAPGLGGADLELLLKASLPMLADADAGLQKRGYKALRWLLSTRTAWLFAPTPAGAASSSSSRAAQLCDALEAAAPCCAPSAKHHRLRVVGALLPPLLLSSPTPASAAASPLLGELILGVKEPNAKARAAAYEIIVALATDADQRAPAAPAPPAAADDDTPMGEGDGGASSHGDAARKMLRLVSAGLGGSSPGMVASSLCAAARLVYDFAPALAPSAAVMLPAVVSLLRSKNREVVKAALGFVKVAAVRLPPDAWLPHLQPALAGLLLWVDDPKNRFRAKVRSVLERLCSKVGHDAVAAAAPPQHAPLLAHMRRGAARREGLAARRKAGGSGGGGDGATTIGASTRGGGGGGRSTRGGGDGLSFGGGGGPRGGRSAAAGGGSEGGRTALTARAAARAAARAPLRVRLAGAEPLDMLDDGDMRRLMHTEAGGGGGGGGDDDDDGEAYARADDGRIVVTDEGGGGGGGRRKRARDGGDDGDDGSGGGGRGGGRSTAGGRSVRGGGTGRAATARAASTRGGSEGGKRSRKDASAPRGAKAGRPPRPSVVHSAVAFRPRKGGAGGDVSASGVQPYAYWPMDAKLLNRRAGRRREAAQGLDAVVSAVRHAGAKAKAKARR